MFRSLRLALAACCLLGLAGCGAEEQNAAYFVETSEAPIASAPSGGDAGIGLTGGVDERYGAVTIQQRPVEGRPADDAPADDAPADGAARPQNVKPRIVYTADLTVVVEDFAAAETALPKLIEQHGGYIARSDVDRSVGDRLRGTWTVRIPVANYSAFLAGAGGLGVVEEKDETAKDVTAEFVDVEARLAGRRALETRLLELLAERPGKLTDVLELERELARVREEIETAEGRLRYLSNQTAFSTITLRVREERDYVPPTRPGFGERIAATWDNSLAALASFGRGLVLFAVAVAPFALTIGLPLALILWLIVRRVRRRRATRS